MHEACTYYGTGISKTLEHTPSIVVYLASAALWGGTSIS